MASPFEVLRQFFQNEGCTPTYWIGFSGGLDSSVLVYTTAALKKILPLKINVVHVHHGLSPQADNWLRHCQTVCLQLELDFQAVKVSINRQPSESLEEVARLKRYAALAKLLQPEDFLLTAHHAEDQAETLLLQLFRGCGPKGLAAMPAKKIWAKGYHARPWLKLSRDELKKYAQAFRLIWLDDESNTHQNLSRNFLRHTIYPLLQLHWPGLTQTLGRTSQHMAEATHLIERSAQADLQTVKKANGNALSVQALLQLEAPRRLQVLRAWIEQAGFRLPPTSKMRILAKNFLQAAPDKNPELTWGEAVLKRYRDTLYLFSNLPQSVDASAIYHWDLSTPLWIPHLGKLTSNSTEPLSVQVRFRVGGEKCHLPGRTGRHCLKKLFQAWGVPPWVRKHVPLIFLGDKLVAVVPYFCHEGLEINLTEC